MKKLFALTLGLILITSVSFAAFQQHQTLSRTPHIGTVKIEIMRTSIDCIPCFMRQTLEAIRMVTDEQAVHENIIRKVLHLAATMDFTLSPPQMGPRHETLWD